MLGLPQGWLENSTVFETLHYKKFLKSQVNSKIQGIVRQYDFFLNVMKTTVTKTKQAMFCVIS